MSEPRRKISEEEYERLYGERERAQICLTLSAMTEPTSADVRAAVQRLQHIHSRAWSFVEHVDYLIDLAQLTERLARLEALLRRIEPHQRFTWCADEIAALLPPATEGR